MSLLTSKHAKYFRLCLNAMPAQALSEDANKLAMVSFCIGGLSLLDDMTIDGAQEGQRLLDEYLVDNDEFTAFRSTSYFRHCDNYDLPNLSGTMFGLSSLLTMGFDYSTVLDRHKIMRFVSKCQVRTGPQAGSFVPTLDTAGHTFGELDLRVCYIAMCIRRLVQYDEMAPDLRVNDIDVDGLQRFVLARMQYNGAFASRYDEGHLGLTFCGLACLKLLGFDFDSAPEFDRTRDWLVHRQVSYLPYLYSGESYEYFDPTDTGGFNGRENKLGDTCYSWWCTASLSLLSRNNLNLFDHSQAVKYLLEVTRNTIVGGFQKDAESRPDPFHSFLALASLSLWQEVGVEVGAKLGGIDESLVITKKLLEFLTTFRW